MAFRWKILFINNSSFVKCFSLGAYKHFMLYRKSWIFIQFPPNFQHALLFSKLNSQTFKVHWVLLVISWYLSGRLSANLKHRHKQVIPSITHNYKPSQFTGTVSLDFIDSVHDVIIEPCMARNKLSNHRFGVINLIERWMLCCTTFHHHVVHINRKSARETWNIKLSLTAALARSIFRCKYSWRLLLPSNEHVIAVFHPSFDVEAFFPLKLRRRKSSRMLINYFDIRLWQKRRACGMSQRRPPKLCVIGKVVEIWKSFDANMI